MADELSSIFERRIPEKNEADVVLDAGLFALAVRCEKELADLW